MTFFYSVAYRILPRLFRPCSPFSSHIASLHQDISQWDKKNHLWGIYSSSRLICPRKQCLHHTLGRCLRIVHCRTENHFCSRTWILKKRTTRVIVSEVPRRKEAASIICIFQLLIFSYMYKCRDFTLPDKSKVRRGFWESRQKWWLFK